MPVPALSCCARSARPMVCRGFGLGSRSRPKRLAEKLRAALGPWPVSGAAIAIGRQGLDGCAMARHHAGTFATDASALDKILAAAGFAPVGGSPLFRLVRHEDAQVWFDRLAKAGFWCGASRRGQTGCALGSLARMRAGHALAPLWNLKCRNCIRDGRLGT